MERFQFLVWLKCEQPVITHLAEREWLHCGRHRLGPVRTQLPVQSTNQQNNPRRNRRGL